MSTKEYMQGIIDATPTGKLLPMTHKNNHGITLETWQKLFAENNIDTKIEQYMHKIYSTDGLKHEPRQQLIVDTASEANTLPSFVRPIFG